MVLYDLHIVGIAEPKHIHVEQGKIKAITSNRIAFDHLATGVRLEFSKALAFPGLINSHDHLDFNLFPQLGNRVYENYTEWGHDIHTNNAEAIKEVTKVPLHLRVQWGLYKNLLNGCTTVINHGERLTINNELITVVQNVYPLHSPAFEKNWKWKLVNPFRLGKPFVMHIGEGTDKAAKNEIDKVIRANRFNRKIIAVHGVAMDEQQAPYFAGLVWCPASNYFLLNKTAAVDKLKNKTNVVFGTDSTLTAPWNLWEHLRQARKSGMVTDRELMDMLMTKPAELWGLDACGVIAEDKQADIIIANRSSDDFFNLEPDDLLLIMHKGHIRMFDESIARQLNATGFSRVIMNGRTKFVQGDLPALIKEVLSYYPTATIPVDLE